MKPTKEEISLCKQVAERHRRRLKFGDWVLINFPRLKETVTLFDTKWGECPDRFPDSPSIYNCSTDEYYKEYFPLWTISDCLEFLRKEGYLVRLVEYEHYGGVKTITCYCHGHKTKGAFSKQGNKDEIACLKAVLAVLEEQPNG